MAQRKVDDPILFISHDAWRTGAPIVLLHFLRWLKVHADVPLAVVLREDVGELRAEFERLAPVFAWNDRRLRSRLQSGRFGLIYSNTITNGEILEALADPMRPVITHVHELNYWITHRMDAENVQQNLRHTSHFVAASNAVKDNLVQKVGIAPTKIDVIPEFIPMPPQRPHDHSARNRLGIPQDAFVVGASGTMDWRKAPDVFIQLAATVRRRGPDEVVHFVWVGGDHQGPTVAALWHDAARADVADRVHFVGTQTDPLAYFAAFDLFASVSREDPFPLVCLEAAALGKPVVCFDRSGGAGEFVEDDAGSIVPYLDVEAMAAAILELRGNSARRARLGERGAAKVRQCYTVDVVAPRLWGLINQVVASVHEGLSSNHAIASRRE